MLCRATRVKGQTIATLLCANEQSGCRWLLSLSSILLDFESFFFSTKWLKSLECLFRNQFHISRECRRRRWHMSMKNVKMIIQPFQEASFLFLWWQSSESTLRRFSRWWWWFARRRMTRDRPFCSCDESQKPHGCCNYPSLTERIVLGWSTSSSYYTSNDAKPRKRLAKMETHLTRILLALWFASMRWRCLIHHIFGSPCYVMRATNFKLGKGARVHTHSPEEVFLFWRLLGGGRSLEGKNILLPTHWFVSYSKFWLTTWWLYQQHWGGSVGDDESAWRVWTWWSDEMFLGE